jgi:hypothetical protein
MVCAWSQLGDQEREDECIQVTQELLYKYKTTDVKVVTIIGGGKCDSYLLLEIPGFKSTSDFQISDAQLVLNL